MPTAVQTLLNLIASPIEYALKSLLQAVVDAAKYPNFATELANALGTNFEGMSTADKEADVVGRLISKMRLLFI